jgi:tetratricopeptide (TPR) repeat protein
LLEALEALLEALLELLEPLLELLESLYTLLEALELLLETLELLLKALELVEPLELLKPLELLLEALLKLLETLKLLLELLLKLLEPLELLLELLLDPLKLLLELLLLWGLRRLGRLRQRLGRGVGPRRLEGGRDGQTPPELLARGGRGATQQDDEDQERPGHKSNGSRVTDHETSSQKVLARGLRPRKIMVPFLPLPEVASASSGLVENRGETAPSNTHELSTRFRMESSNSRRAERRPGPPIPFRQPAIRPHQEPCRG